MSNFVKCRCCGEEFEKSFFSNLARLTNPHYKICYDCIADLEDDEERALTLAREQEVMRNKKMCKTPGLLPETGKRKQPALDLTKSGLIEHYWYNLLAGQDLQQAIIDNSTNENLIAAVRHEQERTTKHIETIKIYMQG